MGEPVTKGINLDMIHIEDIDQSDFNTESSVTEFLALSGEVIRLEKNRKTIRCIRNGHTYYLKSHTGLGWREIVKNLISLKIPVLGAKTEWLAVQRFHQLGIPTVTAVGYGVDGLNPASQRSFIITKDIGINISLEKLAENWSKTPPAPALKRQLIKKLAEISRKLHENGLNHRDYYICHFLLTVPNGADTLKPDNLDIFLIDLHRVQIRQKTPERWAIKDLAGLYFSSMDIGLTSRDLLRFMKIYRGDSFRNIIVNEKSFWEKVRERAVTLYRKEWNREPALTVK